jgi:hypothetical protein
LARNAADSIRGWEGWDDIALEDATIYVTSRIVEFSDTSESKSGIGIGDMKEDDSTIAEVESGEKANAVLEHNSTIPQAAKNKPKVNRFEVAKTFMIQKNSSRLRPVVD